MTNSHSDDSVNNALKAIQQERSSGEESSKVIRFNQEDKSEILQGLPVDDNSVDSDSQLDEAESNTASKVSKPKKNSSISNIYKNISYTFIFIVIVCIGGLGYWMSQPETPSLVSLPSFSKWTLFNANEVKDPVITESMLKDTIQKLQGSIDSALVNLPVMKRVDELETKLGNLKMVSIEQKRSIDNLNRKFSSLVVKYSTVISPADVALIKSDLDTLNDYTGDILTKFKDVDANSESLATLAKLTKDLKNTNWANFKRIKKLEEMGQVGKSNVVSSNSVTKTKPMASAQAVTWDNKPSWKLKIISDRFTQIVNTKSNKSVRIYKGGNIPSCGVVLSIDVVGRKVTTPHCVITR